MSSVIFDSQKEQLALPPPDRFPRKAVVQPGMTVTIQGNITIYNDSLYPLDVTVRFDLQKGFSVSVTNSIGYFLEFDAPMFSIHSLSVRDGAIVKDSQGKGSQGGARLLKSLDSRV